MLLSSSAVSLLIGAVAALVLGTIALFRLRRPRGRIHWIGLVLSVAVGGVAFVMLAAASHVIRVTSDLQIREGRVIGTATERVGDRDVELVAHGSGVTLILNESASELRVETRVYGELPPKTMVPPDATIEAHSVYPLHANVDYVGPHAEPPDEVHTNGGGTIKYWLTW